MMYFTGKIERGMGTNWPTGAIPPWICAPNREIWNGREEKSRGDEKEMQNKGIRRWKGTRNMSKMRMGMRTAEEEG
jgi:hypothetical protein